MPRRAFVPTPTDVFVCCHEPGGLELARTIAEGLRRIGFRVAFGARSDPGQTADARAALIADAPDFLLVTAGATPTAFAEDRQLRQEVGLALERGRVVVPVTLSGEPRPDPSSLPSTIADALRHHTVTWDAARPAESLALVAHALSSDAALEDRRLMRRARWAAAIVAAIVLAVVAAYVVPPIYRAAAARPPHPPIAPFAIAWAAIGERHANGRQSAFHVSDETEVAAGDRIKLLFAPSAAGHAYVLARYPGRGVAVLFPGAAMRGAGAVKAGQTYDAPIGQAWLEVGQTDGPDAVFIIASYDPLENLEELAEDADTADAAAERLDLLAGTLSGLLDGRRGPPVRRPRTRAGHPVDTTLPPFRGQPRTFAIEAGVPGDRPFAIERGLISAAVVITLRPTPAR